MRFSRSPDRRDFMVDNTTIEKVSIGPRLTEIATGSRWAEDQNDQFPTDFDKPGHRFIGWSTGSAFFPAIFSLPKAASSHALRWTPKFRQLAKVHPAPKMPAVSGPGGRRCQLIDANTIRLSRPRWR